MPIQIRELVISATIENGATGSPAVTSSATPTNDAGSREELIQACVDQVLKVLKRQQRR